MILYEIYFFRIQGREHIFTKEYLNFYFQNRALELITKGDKKLFNKIRDLSNAMYKQLGSSPSVNPYSQNYGNDTNEKASSGKTSNSNSETRTHASTRSQASDARGSTTSTQPIQDEPLELTVQKTSSGEKAKSSKKQPKTAPILQQKKLQQTKKQGTVKTPSPATAKKSTKNKNTSKTKSPTKIQKEKAPASSDSMDGRRPRRGAAIAASAAMMAQKVLDKQLSSASVAFSDESSTEDDFEDNSDEADETIADSNAEAGKVH